MPNKEDQCMIFAVVLFINTESSQSQDEIIEKVSKTC